MNNNANKRCNNCKLKPNCDAWQDKSETTVSGWDKNRFAISCREFIELNKPQCKDCNEFKDGKCTRIGKNGEVGICWMELSEEEY